MNVASSLALAVAERVERTGGPRAGLVAWKTLAGNSTDGELRGKALLAALRCALALRDETALGELTALWSSVDRGVWDASIAALCKEMVRAGGNLNLIGRATELAKTEAERHRTALSLYTHARLLDVSGDPGAASAFRAVIERASSEGAKEIVLNARIRRATILARSWETMTEALQEASAVNLGAAEGAAAPASAKLALARVLLFSPSRFVRASAIGVLDELAASSSSGGAGIEALALAAAWADDAANSSVMMTPLETDRLVALFGREPILKIAPHGKDAIRAIDRMMRSRESEVDAVLDEMSKLDPSLTPQHVRARDILRGRYEVPRTGGERLPQDPTKRRAFRQQEILDVVVAMRDAAPARAARSLRMLAEAEEGGEHLPPEALAVAQAALEHESNAELRDVAVRFFSARLRRATYGAPPKGYLALADSLAALGRDELSATARHAAVSLKEPGAAESLGTALARQGWDYAKKNSPEERESAIKKLREAKRLLD